VEIVLAAAAGVAAFVVAALVSAAARPHVPLVLVGPLLLLAVLAMARFAGILYALPVGVATVLAFDWYLLPPLRDLDAATVLVLGLFLGTSVIVGAFATTTSRRVIASEQARGAIAEEQFEVEAFYIGVALRRVGMARNEIGKWAFARSHDSFDRINLRHGCEWSRTWPDQIADLIVGKSNDTVNRSGNFRVAEIDLSLFHRRFVCFHICSG